MGRIYLELAIVRCHIFMERDPFPGVFKRLSLMCRGVADPLAASYLRTYLARRYVNVAAQGYICFSFSVAVGYAYSHA